MGIWDIYDLRYLGMWLWLRPTTKRMVFEKKMYLNPTVDHHTLSKNCNIYIFGVNPHRSNPSFFQPTNAKFVEGSARPPGPPAWPLMTSHTPSVAHIRTARRPVAVEPGHADGGQMGVETWEKWGEKPLNNGARHGVVPHFSHGKYILNNGERHGNSDLLKHGCWWKLLQQRSLKDIPSILWILLVGYYGIISTSGNMYDHVANPLFVCQFLHRQLVTTIQFSQGKCFNKHIDEDFRWTGIA